MSEDKCPHCLTPYSDEADENGQHYCGCSESEVERLTKENERIAEVLSQQDKRIIHLTSRIEDLIVQRDNARRIALLARDGIVFENVPWWFSRG